MKCSQQGYVHLLRDRMCGRTPLWTMCSFPLQPASCSSVNLWVPPASPLQGPLLFAGMIVSQVVLHVLSFFAGLVLRCVWGPACLSGGSRESDQRGWECWDQRGTPSRNRSFILVLEGWRVAFQKHAPSLPSEQPKKALEAEGAQSGEEAPSDREQFLL